MHKIDVDAIFMPVTAKKGVNIHSKRSISYIYKEYIQLEEIKVMGALDPDSITK